MFLTITSLVLSECSASCVGTSRDLIKSAFESNCKPYSPREAAIFSDVESQQKLYNYVQIVKSLIRCQLLKLGADLIFLCCQLSCLVLLEGKG